MMVSTRVGIIVILMSAALLSMEIEQYRRLVPYSAEIMLGIQLTVSFLCLLQGIPRVRGPELLILGLVACLFAWSLASGFWSNDVLLSVRRSVLVFVPTILFLFLVYADRRPSKTFFWLSTGMALFGSVVAVWGVVIYTLGQTFQLGNRHLQVLTLGPFRFEQYLFGRPPLFRIASLAGNPNVLAQWLLFSLVFTTALWLSGRLSRRWVPVLLFASIVQSAALVLTFSRAGILSTVIAMTFLLVLNRQGLFARLKGLLAIVGLGLVVGFVPLLVIENLDVLAQRFSLDLTGREDAWKYVWDAFVRKPLTGVGFGLAYESILEPQGLRITAHSAYLSIISEIGLIGHTLFIALWLTAIAFAVRRSGKKVEEGTTEYERIIYAACAAILVGLLAHQVVENQILRYNVATFFWAYCIGLATSRKWGTWSELALNGARRGC